MRLRSSPSLRLKASQRSPETTSSSSDSPSGSPTSASVRARGLRARTEALVGLPEGESLELEVVSGERWLAFNRRLGELRSRISINTDASLPAVDLAYVAAHEGYP